MRRLIVAGLTIGVALGGLFGLAVVSFADCAGPDCTYQRMVASPRMPSALVWQVPRPASSFDSSNSFGTAPASLICETSK